MNLSTSCLADSSLYFGGSSTHSCEEKSARAFVLFRMQNREIKNQLRRKAHLPAGLSSRRKTTSRPTCLYLNTGDHSGNRGTISSLLRHLVGQAEGMCADGAGGSHGALGCGHTGTNVARGG
eukprot:4261982-Prymnesium_polylepis.1